MRVHHLRTYMIVGLGLMAAAVISFTVPATAGPEPGLYLAMEVPDLALPDFATAEERAALARAEEMPTLEESRSIGRLGPVYQLSLETHGQSLPYHRRC